VADAIDPAELAEAAEAEAEPKKKPRRGGKAKPKTEEAAEQPTEAPAAEEKPKPKPRRGKKKAEGEGDAAEGEDDKPKYMGGAERRTSAGDDEPEIRPFFDDSDDFDPDAPNDRFESE